MMQVLSLLIVITKEILTVVYELEELPDGVLKVSPIVTTQAA